MFNAGLASSAAGSQLLGRGDYQANSQDENADSRDSRESAANPGLLQPRVSLGDAGDDCHVPTDRNDGPD